LTADEKTFGVILADPPWDYRQMSDSAHGAAEAAMETMPTLDIAAIPVARWAAPDTVLFLWATWPKLWDAFVVAKAWGFDASSDHVTAIPWVKTVPSTHSIYSGIGWWTRGASEALLIFRRGKVSPPAVTDRHVGLIVGEGERADRIFWAQRGVHSAKPTMVREWCGKFGERRLELFAREAAPGWTAWGLDLGFRLGPEGVKLVEPKVDRQGVFGWRG